MLYKLLNKKITTFKKLNLYKTYIETQYNIQLENYWNSKFSVFSY